MKTHILVSRWSKTSRAAGVQLCSWLWLSFSLQESGRRPQHNFTPWFWLPTSSLHCHAWSLHQTQFAAVCSLIKFAVGVTRVTQTQYRRPFESDFNCQCRNTRRVFGRKARRWVCETLYLQSCRCVCWNLPGWQVRVFHHHCQQGISELLHEPFSL